MNTETGTARGALARGIDGRCRALLLGVLRELKGARIRLEDPWGTAEAGDADTSAPLLTLAVRTTGVYRKILLQGTVGAAMSFIDGEWHCDDLVAFMQLVIRNRDVLFRLETFRPLPVRLARLAAHRLRGNTKRGSARNIRSHYDLGNEFFATFLDPTLSYSCAFFDSPETSLEQASVAKMDRIIRKLKLSSKDHLLEIGCGWGALAMKAARETGCRVTAVTISREQHELARRRVAEAGLGERVQIELKDYRDLKGRFTRIASIEMIEAVGYDNYDAFFKKCGDVLTHDGLFVMQAITRPDHSLRAARGDVEFIQAEIFPGSELPTISALCAAAGATSDLVAVDLEDITPHYAETLKRWRIEFTARLDRVQALGFGPDFIRKWTYYLACCEAGFRERHMGDIQLVFARQGWRGEMPG